MSGASLTACRQRLNEQAAIAAEEYKRETVKALFLLSKLDAANIDEIDILEYGYAIT